MTHTIGIQMKRKEVTRTYYDFKLKEALGLHGLYHIEHRRSIMYS